MEMIKTLDLIKHNILKAAENSDVSHWAIYGTKKGAELVWQALDELGFAERIEYIFDKEDTFTAGKSFHGHPVSSLLNGLCETTIIFVGAEFNHRLVYERLLKRAEGIVTVIDPFLWDVTEQDKDDYLHYIDKYIEGETFVPICQQHYVPMEDDPKVIAWYLPQFHQMEINNKYHGQGFTEWTNTTRTMPQFAEHYQPHVPYDVGYYDLLNPDTFKRQIFLAKKYGIYGFGFFYYWYSGEKIMEKPVEMLLAHKELEIPFCLHWATEDWSMSWYDVSGKESKAVVRMELPDVDCYWKDIAPFFRDQRYIKIQGKPLLVIYKCTEFQKDKFQRFLDELRCHAKEEGFPDLYIMISTGNTGTFEDADLWGGNALVEYQPWSFYQAESIEKVLPKGYLNPGFIGNIADIRTALRQKEYMCPHKCKKYFRSALASWDNSARKKEQEPRCYGEIPLRI